MEYEITVTNIGDAPATNVVVKDLLVNGLQYTSAQPSPASVTGNEIEWNLDTLTPGESIALHLYAKAISFGTLHNYVNVTCNEGLYDEDDEYTNVINDTEPPHTRKVFHGTVYNISIWGIYILHYIPTTTNITLKAIDYPIPGASGVNHTYYRIWDMDEETGKWHLLFDFKEYHGEKINFYSIAGYGKYEIEFYSIDRVGNIEKMEWNDLYVYQSEEEIPS